MKSVLILTVLSGFAMASPAIDNGADNYLSKRCHNRDDARRDAEKAGCKNVRWDNHQGTWCNMFGCNCDWGCNEVTSRDEWGHEKTGKWYTNRCPKDSNVSITIYDNEQHLTLLIY